MNFDASKCYSFILSLFFCRNCHEMAIFYNVKVLHYQKKIAKIQTVRLIETVRLGINYHS